MKNIHLLLVITIILYASCKQSSNNNNIAALALPADVAGPVVQVDSIPLQVGHQWIYKKMNQVISQYTNQTTSKLSMPDSGSVTISSVTDTLVNGVRFTRLSASTSGSLFLFSIGDDNGYYINLFEGTHRITNFSHTDTTYLIDSTDNIMRTPNRLNTIWYTPNGVRQWMGYVTVTTPAGTFNCVKLHYTGSFGNGEDYWADQYYSTKGLVQEIQYRTTVTSVGTGTHLAQTFASTWTLSGVNF